MKPWVIYIRVSTDEQAAHGVSLDAQRKSCENYLNASDIPIGEVIEDAGHSAKSLRRPGIQHVLGLLAKGTIGGVIAWKLDRLSRTVRDLWDLIECAEKSHCAVACVVEKIDTSGPFGRFMVTILAALAQLERETTTQRVTEAQKHIRAKGGFAGGPIPVGIRAVGERGNRKLELDPTTAPAMAKVWAMVLDGASLRDLLGYLNATVRTRKGKPWAMNTVSDYLRNEQLVGMLVTRERFDAVQAELDRRASPRRRGKHYRQLGVRAETKRADRIYLLAGLALCAHCGAALVGTYGTGRNGPVHYYRCSSNNRRGAAGCAAPLFPATLAEDAVLKALRIATEGKAGQLILDAWNDRDAAAQAAAGPLEERRRAKLMVRDRAQERVDRLVDSLASGGATARAVQAALEKHQTELEEANLAIMQLDAELAAVAKVQGDAMMARQLMRERIASLTAATREEQAEDLPTVIRTVTLAADVPKIVLNLWIDPPNEEQSSPGWFAQSIRNGGPFRTLCEPLQVSVGVPLALRRPGANYSAAAVGEAALLPPEPEPARDLYPELPATGVPADWFWSRLEEALGRHPALVTVCGSASKR